MALVGDRIKIIDRASPWLGSEGEVVSGEFRGRYVVALDQAPVPRVGIELIDSQFIVTGKTPPSAADLVSGLSPFAEAARWYDEDFPDELKVLAVGEAVITLGDLRRAARLSGVSSS